MSRENYEEEQEEKRERYAQRAEKLRAAASAAYRKADLREEVTGIPFGQPILVGHHSERRHRKTLERADNAMRRAIDTDNKAAALEAKVAHPSQAISSDDPAATDMLTEKLAKLEANQTRMKAVNAAHKAWTKDPGGKASKTKMAALTEAERLHVQGYRPAYSWEPHPYPPYQLSNNNANIKRVKDRISSLTREAGTNQPPLEVIGKGFTIVEDRDENRMMARFDTKPSRDVCKIMRTSGFKWSPTRTAWVRLLNNAARWNAAEAARQIELTTNA